MSQPPAFNADVASFSSISEVDHFQITRKRPSIDEPEDVKRVKTTVTSEDEDKENVLPSATLPTPAFDDFLSPPQLMMRPRYQSTPFVRPHFPFSGISPQIPPSIGNFSLPPTSSPFFSTSSSDSSGFDSNYSSFYNSPLTTSSTSARSLGSALSNANSSVDDEEGYSSPPPLPQQPAVFTPDPRGEFAQVPGRLALLSAATKHKVTNAEIERRINAPECLNASLLGGILRKAKAKDGGNQLRQLVHQKTGHDLSVGRRKMGMVTPFTALTEEEAVQMGRDFHQLSVKYLEPKKISYEMFYGRLVHLAQTNQLPQEMIMLDQFRTILEMFKMIIQPMGQHPQEYVPRHPVDAHFNQFSLMTHGFGHTAFLAVVDSLRGIVCETRLMAEAMLKGQAMYAAPYPPPTV